MPDALQILVRFALYVDLIALFGIAAFGIYGLKARVAGEAGAILRSGILAAAILAPMLSIGAALALVSQMAGVSIGEIDADLMAMFLAEMPPGRASAARVAVAFVALIAAISLCRRQGRHGALLWVIALSAAIALSTLAWAGHGAMGEGTAGWVQLASDIIHLLASGAWVGALFAMVLLLIRPAARIAQAELRALHRALHGFASAGAIMVGLLLVTGLVNAWLLMGADGLAMALTTVYGRLLALKLLLFAAMLILASVNRFRLTPGLERAIAAGEPRVAIGALRRSLAVETLSAVLILAIVAAIGLMAPPSVEI